MVPPIGWRFWVYPGLINPKPYAKAHNPAAQDEAPARKLWEAMSSSRLLRPWRRAKA